MGGLSCGGSCMKMLLFVFNGLFFLGGVLMMGLGIWFLVDPNISDKLDFISFGADKMFKAAAITMIVVGILILVIGFLGCCGACRESSGMLCMFVVFVCIIFALEITTAVLAAVFKDEIGDGLLDEMEKQVHLNVTPVMPNSPNNSATSMAWHGLQYDLHCCGANNYTDYKVNKNFNTSYPMPKTCCMLENDDIDNPIPVNWGDCKTEFSKGTPPQDAMQLHTTGCYVSLGEWFRHKAGILIGVACGIFVIQILGIVFACCVRQELKRKKEFV